MNKLFRPKCMRRMAVFMALVAPIIYLFGSLFFALNGAHGTKVFADDLPLSETTSFGNSDFSEHVQLGGTWGEFYTSGSREWASCYFSVESPFDLRPNDSEHTSGMRFVFSIYADDNSFVTNSTYYGSNIAAIYYDGEYSKFGVSWYSITDPNALVTDYSFEVVRHFNDLNPVSYSDYVFGQFFDKDNFLVKWGENAISENPYGFAPFGYFWRYLDTNVLHLSNEQVGLMAYGYMYYASHVLLFDVGFILVTFFLTFIQKVADKIGGEDYA